MSAIAESINTALAEMDKTTNVDAGKTESVGAVSENEEATETTTESVTEESKLSAQETQEGINLARALKDPTLGPALIDYLATKSGYTKGELKAALKEPDKETLIDDLSEALPPGFEYLGEKLLPAIKKYVDSKVEANTKDIRETANAAQIRHLEGVITDAQIDFSKQYYDGKALPNDLLTEVNRLSNIYTPQPGADPKDHVLNLLHMAKGRVGTTKASNTKTPAKQANASVPNVLAAQKTVTPTSSGNGKPQKLTLKESVDQALSAMNIKE